MSRSSFIKSTLSLLGLGALHSAPLDVHLILLQRSLRLFAYGSSTLILALLFRSLSFTDTQLGAFMTLTLLGDVVLSLLLTLVADRVGRRRILLLGAGMMALSGVVFALSSNFLVLLMAAVVGVISPSGNEIGPFRSIEDSLLSHLTSPAHLSEIYAISGMFASMSTAVGQLATGYLTRILQTSGWTQLQSYRAVFWVYAVCAVGKGVLVWGMSEACEVRDSGTPGGYALVEQEEAAIDLAGKDDDDSGLPSPQQPPPSHRVATSSLASFFPTLSRESQPTVLKLSLLLALDSFSSGLVPISLITYYYSLRFLLSPSTLGVIFSLTSLISGITQLASAHLSNHLGLLTTMFFTHLPSSVLIGLIPLPGLSLPWASALLIVRFATGTMDLAPRSALISQLLLPSELTPTLGLLNTIRTLSQAVGPYISGMLSEKGEMGWAFVAAAGAKVVYDFGMLAAFSGWKARESVK